jgi:hypothetical protein
MFHDINFILQPLFQSVRHFFEKREGSGSVLVTNISGYGSGRLNNIRIRILMRIHIRNTDFLLSQPSTGKNICLRQDVKLSRMTVFIINKY